jgi:hypothetical protein
MTKNYLLDKRFLSVSIAVLGFLLLALLATRDNPEQPLINDIKTKGVTLSYLCVLYSERHGRYPNNLTELTKERFVSKTELDQLLKIRPVRGEDISTQWVYTPEDANILMYVDRPIRYTQRRNDRYTTQLGWFTFNKSAGSEVISENEVPKSESEVIDHLASADFLGTYDIGESNAGSHLLMQITTLKGRPGERRIMSYYNPDAVQGHHLMFAAFKNGSEKEIYCEIENENIKWMLLPSRKTVPIPISRIERKLAAQ